MGDDRCRAAEERQKGSVKKMDDREKEEKGKGAQDEEDESVVCPCRSLL